MAGFFFGWMMDNIIKDITNEKFGRLTAVEFIERKNKKTYWKWKCDCGRICIKPIAYVCRKDRKAIKSCGCLTKEQRKLNGSKSRLDLTNKKYGKLTAIRRICSTEKGQSIWHFICDCGNYLDILSSSVLSGNTISCGCEANKIGINSPAYIGYKNLSGVYFCCLKKGAESRNLEFLVSIEEIYSILEKQDFKCALSGIEIRLEPSSSLRKKNNDLHTASLDRIDSSRGYTLDNLQWIHKDLQKIKMDMHDINFINWCHTISDYQRSI